MSFALVAELLKPHAADVPPAQRLVLLSLADSADDTGRTFRSLSVAELSGRTGLCRRAIQISLRALTETGWISVVSIGGGRRASVYRVHASKQPMLPLMAEAKAAKAEVGGAPDAPLEAVRGASPCASPAHGGAPSSICPIKLRPSQPSHGRAITTATATARAPRGFAAKRAEREAAMAQREPWACPHEPRCGSSTTCTVVYSRDVAAGAVALEDVPANLRDLVSELAEARLERRKA